MTVNTIYLRQSVSNEFVEATFFDDVTDAHLAMWSETWRPAMARHCAGRKLRDNPEDGHWDWQRKAEEWRPLLGYHAFSIVCGNELQGLMLASDLKFARLQVQAGKPLVYIVYLATAPWNRPEVKTPPRYRGVGTVFMAAAIQLSIDMDYRGRIGLHALPAAEPFYRKCGMTPLGRDVMCQKLMYYEMTEAQSKRFRQERS